jgi:UDP:flavonoid glycosyltransferase YjiC (YdhE family)
MASARDLATEVWLSRCLTLVAISPALCRAQPDWPDTLHVCGFLDAPGMDIDGRIPATLAAFLDDGAAPVYMTFGSWMPKDVAGQTRALELLTQSARLAGCRAIIQGPSAHACGFSSDRQVLYVSTAPHQAIFPRCSAVVHHGGAGTTQAATRAGKPSVIVANISEQEHWARELRRLGIGARLTRRRSVTVAELARRIRHVLDAPGMSARAQAIAGAMRGENGVDEAVRLIVQRLAGHTAAPELELEARHAR